MAHHLRSNGSFYLYHLVNFVIIYLATFPKESLQGSHERRLLNDLLKDYNMLERPVFNESNSLSVSFGLTLQQIIDVDEKNQMIVTNIMINMEWVDSNLRWNPAKYGGVIDIRIASNRIWKPDILLYNSADERIDSTFPAMVVVKSNGSCTWLPPGIFKSTCKIDITWFPFDDQICKMKFGSWSYSGSSLDLQLNSQEADLSAYIENGEWKLLGIPGVRNEVRYQCCPSPYIDITFDILIRRRTLYYGFNLIVPCMIISSMVLLGFTLPPESGEKLTLGVTILLSMSVFMLQLQDILPPTSDSVSIIGAYFACMMLVVACSVVMTVVVLNFHHKTHESHEMNKWVKLIVLDWLAFLLRMKKPGYISPPKRASLNQSSKYKKDFKDSGLTLSSQISNYTHYANLNPQILTSTIETENDLIQMNSVDCNCIKCNQKYQANYSNQVYPQSSHTIGEGYGGIRSETILSSSTQSPKKPVSKEIFAILGELKFITNRMRKEDELSDIIQDWKFAGMVMDRLCLFVFTAFTTISTVICLSSAPHLIV